MEEWYWRESLRQREKAGKSSGNIGEKEGVGAHVFRGLAWRTGGEFFNCFIGSDWKTQRCL